MRQINVSGTFGVADRPIYRTWTAYEEWSEISGKTWLEVILSKRATEIQFNNRLSAGSTFSNTLRIGEQ